MEYREKLETSDQRMYDNTIKIVMGAYARGETSKEGIEAAVAKCVTSPVQMTHPVVVTGIAHGIVLARVIADCNTISSEDKQVLFSMLTKEDANIQDARAEAIKIARKYGADNQ
ncbi:MAG: hypothetical protein Q7R96_03865 [Nanoarchaeota archaeon]|nr:hypothetical protein [Nanoarchaeota archaeon]